jgi:uncharacterized protein (DUF1697 family)
VGSERTRYVALLRGINLGRARQVDMPRLREVLEGRGHGGVRTHLRSGNVVLDSVMTEQELAADVTAAMAAEFAMDVPVVVRTGADLAGLVAENPLRRVVTDPARYLVTFMAAPPDPGKVAALPPAEDGEYVVRGRELLMWLPDGIQRTALASWKWDRLLGVPGTARNWNTVTKLAELAT